MGMISCLVFGYALFGILLLCRMVYLKARLFRYVYRQYPEQGKVIRSYAGSRRHGYMLHKTLKALIEQHSTSDTELARMAKTATRSSMYFLVWFVLALIIFSPIVLFLLLK